MPATRLIALTIAAAAFAGLGHAAWAEDPTNAAATAPPRTPSGVPHWERRPSGDGFAMVYPARALSYRAGGRVVMRCKVDAQGGMVGCEIVSETPPDQGFGQAALKLSRLFKMSTTTSSGVSVAGATVEIPIRFQMPD